MEKSSRRIGDSGELYAIKHLQEKGLQILETNYTVKGGEIDIIAKDGDIIVFVEVKLRSSTRFGIPEEALTRTKKRHILSTIYRYCSEKKVSLSKIRADFISIMKTKDDMNITHHENIALN